jgi:aerobic-type carbon monoxide dehydrogenase small subunit (CoxS/CutS family)
MADEEKVPAEEGEQAPMKISRRDFLVGAGAGVVVTGAVAAGIVALQEPKTVEVIKEVPVEVIKEVPVETGTGTTTGPVTTVTTGLPATMRQVSLKIDGTTHNVLVDVRESLWETMTKKLGLGSAINLGCDRAQCGACAVVVDGRAVNGCSILSARLGRGQEIVTVAGLATGTTEADLHPVQRAYWEEGGYQCGICTRGFIMSTYALLTHNPNPTDEEVHEALSGNICRCSEYPMILNSVAKAAELMRAA